MGEEKRDSKEAPRKLEAPSASVEKAAAPVSPAPPAAKSEFAPAPAVAPAPAAAADADAAREPAPPLAPPPAAPPPAKAAEPTTRSLTWSERRAERRAERRRQRGRRAEDHRRADDTHEPPKRPDTLRLPAVQPGSRTENVVAVFLLGVIVGCAGIWIEHNRCPGALKTAAYAAAPGACAVAVPIAAAIAWGEKHASRARKTRHAILFAAWAVAAALSVATAGMLRWNERGPLTTETARCRVARRETVAAPTSGVADWIVVISCSDRMSNVRIDVDRARWWASEPGGTVDATLVRGPLGFAWVVDVPSLGQPTRGI